jgi:hypothetical protein
MAKAKSQKSKSPTVHDHINIIAGLFFVLVFAIITGLSGFAAYAAKPLPVLTTPNLSLSPSSGIVSAGSTLAVQIWEDSGTNTVNAVQANLVYPIGKLNFVKIDTTNTAFGVEAESTGSNGSIRIGRGSTTPLQGRQLVATVDFTPLGATARHRSSATVSFSPGTVLLSSVTNSDILAATYGGTYSL